MLKYILLPMMSLLAACTTARTHESVLYEYIDSPAEKRIYVEYLNTHSWSVCIYDGDWPRETGFEDVDGTVFAIHVGKKTYVIDDYNPGYPPSKRYFEVRSGEKIRSFLRYEHFKIPVLEYNLEKSVTIKPEWKRC